MTFTRPLVWSLGLCLLAGCGPGTGSSPKGKVALVDAIEAAGALGREGVLAAYDAETMPPRGQGPGPPVGRTADSPSSEAEQQRLMRDGLIRNFRAELRPAARRVAQQQGMSIVMIKRDDMVLYTSRTNDITSQVIDEIQGQARASGGGSGSGGSGGSGSGGGGGSGSGGGGSGGDSGSSSGGGSGSGSSGSGDTAEASGSENAGRSEAGEGGAADGDDPER